MLSFLSLSLVCYHCCYCLLLVRCVGPSCPVMCCFCMVFSMLSCHLFVICVVDCTQQSEEQIPNTHTHTHTHTPPIVARDSYYSLWNVISSRIIIGDMVWWEWYLFVLPTQHAPHKVLYKNILQQLFGSTWLGHIASSVLFAELSYLATNMTFSAELLGTKITV